MPARQLIVNADDFGLTEGVNLGIMRCLEEGILTSASLMVRGAGAASAGESAIKHPELSVGLHVDLAEWVCRDYEWVPKYQVVPTDDGEKVAAEVARQLEAFRTLVGKDPTHIDSHQHAHRQEPVLSVMLEVARKLSVPLRSFTSEVKYCGDFYGQTGEGDPYPEGISVDGLIRIFANLPPGITELGCHPGDDEYLDSVYRLERQQEVSVLCDERVSNALAESGVELCSFADVIPLKSRTPG